LLVIGLLLKGPPSPFLSTHRFKVNVIKSFFLNILLMLASATIFLLVVEGGVRVSQAVGLLPVLDGRSVSLQGPSLEEHNSKLLMSDNPNLVLEYDVSDPKINQFGMRDHPYELVASEGVRRIAAIGDSVTFGLGVALENTYSKKLESALNREATERHGFQVMNFGISGYSTETELELFKLKARPFKPDVVVVGYVMNDPIHTSAVLDAITETMKYESDFGKLAKVSQVMAWVKLTWANVMMGIDGMSVYEPLYAVEGEPWANVVESLMSFKQLSQEDGFQLVVVVFPMLHDFNNYPFEQYHEQVLRLLSDLDIDHIDLLPPYSEFGADEFRILESDTWHPNDLGHKIAAEKLQAYLEGTGVLADKTEVVE
jgi:lysophospholipase L1-like esterase